MPNYVEIGEGANTDIFWGTKTLVTGVGEVTAVKNKTTGEVRNIKDGDGNTFIKVLFDDMEEAEVTAIASTAAGNPARGELLTIAGQAGFIVEDFDEDWTAGQEKQLTIRAVYHTYLDTTP